MILYFVLFHRYQPRWLTQILAIKPENSQMLQLQSTAHNESLILLQWMTWIYTPQDVSLQVLGSLNPNLNLSWKLNPINDLDEHRKRIPFHLGHFQRYLLVGGLVFSVMSLPLFNEFCELRRAPWRWDFCQCLGWYDLSFKQTWRRFWCFFVFFPQESLNIEHLLILPQHKRHLVKIPLDILTADGGHCVRTLHSKSQGCLGVEFRCH